MTTDYAIEPLKITDFNRDDEALQRFMIFGIIAAGKDSDWAAAKVSDLLRKKPDGVLPLAYLAENEIALHNTLVANRVGQYQRIKRAILDAAKLDLRTAAVEEIEGIFGVGPKTARLFILHSRPDADVAVLDTHILKWLGDVGVDPVPKTTPSGKAYERLERLAVRFKKIYYPGMSLAQADLLIWSKYSGRFSEEVSDHESVS